MMRSREPVYSEAILPERAYGWSPLFSLRDETRQYIEAPEPELYDLGQDPSERRNIVSSSPDEVRTWRQRLEATVGSFGPGDPGSGRPMSDEERQRLASLGYLSGGAVSGARRPGPDPRTRASLHNDLLDAKRLVSAGQPVEARRRLARLLEADPDNPAALCLEGVLEFSSGRREQGLERLRSAARKAPAVYENQINLANALHEAGRLEEAAPAYRAAVALRPGDAGARYALGNLLFAMHDPAGALSEYEEAVRLRLASPGLYAALGVAREAVGDTVGARV